MQILCKFKFLYCICPIFNNKSKYIIELHPLSGRNGHVKSYEKLSNCGVNYTKSVTLST